MFNKTLRIRGTDSLAYDGSLSLELNELTNSGGLRGGAKGAMPPPEHPEKKGKDEVQALACIYKRKKEYKKE